VKNAGTRCGTSLRNGGRQREKRLFIASQKIEEMAAPIYLAQRGREKGPPPSITVDSNQLGLSRSLERSPTKRTEDKGNKGHEAQQESGSLGGRDSRKMENLLSEGSDGQESPRNISCRGRDEGLGDWTSALRRGQPLGARAPGRALERRRNP